MIRGEKALTEIVADHNHENERATNEFTTSRDTAMACRLYYHGRLRERRYDVCIAHLSKEFFISQTVVTQRLMMQQRFLKELVIKKVSARDLQAMFPAFNWKLDL